jgi:hypothetical protein
VRRSAPANFGAPLPSFWDCEGFETDNLARQPAGMRRAATLPHGSTHGETMLGFRRQLPLSNIGESRPKAGPVGSQ